MKRFIKITFLTFLITLLAFKGPQWYQLLAHQNERNELIRKNIIASNNLINTFTKLPFTKQLPSSEEHALMLALMVVEENPEGISQLEMIFRAHNRPLLIKSEDSQFFNSEETLTHLYQEYLERVENIGENTTYISRRDTVNYTADNFTDINNKNIQHIAITSDFQMRDEESPLHLYPIKPFFPTSYYPASPHVPYIVDDAIKGLRAYEKKENIEMDFVIYTGDLTDNGHYNEVRWGIDVLDGGLIDPDSGNDDDIFDDRYANGEPNDTADSFTAIGLKGHADTKTIPWYFVHGNHDGLAMGVFNMTYEPSSLLFMKLDNGTFGFMNEVSIGDYNYLGRSPNLRSFISYYFSDEEKKKIVADNDRRLLNATEISKEMFKTTGLPIGHGMQWVKDISQDRSYSFLTDNGIIKNIVLDTNTSHLLGSFPDHKMIWLKNELEAATENKQLVIVSSHHSPAYIVDNGTHIIELLQRYPNVIAHLVAHTHSNDIAPQIGNSAENSYWQIETASMVNWPQQLRILDIQLDHESGMGTIKSTMLNHHSKNPYAISQRGRFLAYLESYLKDGESHLVGDEGEAEDRNALLYFKIPENFINTDI